MSGTFWEFLTGVAQENLSPDQVQITQTILHTKDACLVQLEAIVGENVYSTTGSSKRESVDKPNLEIGVELALARALKQLASQINRHANKLVREQEKQRQSSLAAKEAAKKIREERAKVAKANIKTTTPKRARKTKVVA